MAQRRVLGGHTHRAGVQVAFAHHDAALDHQGCSSETEFIGTQQGTNRHIAAGFHLTVGLHPNATAQTIHHQGLLGFGQADFPRAARMLDGRPRRRTGAAVVTGDHHMVGLALGHTRGNRAHADLGHQLHADVGMGRDVFQVVDQLRQIFNGINVVVRWRRNEAHAGHRVAQEPDVLGHLGAGQLPTLAGFGTLRHLDLDLVRAAEVFSGHAKAARGHLLDFGAQRVPRQQGHIDFDLLVANHALQRLARFDGDAFEFVAVASRVFAAFTGVAFAADAVHGHCQSGVGFGGDGAQ